ncbi:Lrp/AsnC family transcriptional regulator [Candidatus Pacearchaeota archaeon]|nr:Lrp/AsnC family transcriptional regulator [Candidatus Pacearchaeota archaeon]
MKSKIKKLLFECTKNSRITTKELGKRIEASQQSASYLLNTLKRKKIIESPSTIVDAVKFGFINVIVGINFIKTDHATKKQVLEDLRDYNSITGIEECKEGVDLIIDYVVPNLSAFNKVHLEIADKFSNKTRIVFVYPIIVSHEYYKNYLIRKFDSTDKILFGDREIVEISNDESLILKELVRTPDKKLIDMAESTNVPIKSVIKIKRDLERKGIIRGYTSILNNNKLGIQRQIILLKFLGEGVREIDKFSDYAKNNKNIIRFLKLIGEYQTAIIIEEMGEINLIRDIRENFPIENYRIMKSEKIHKKNYLPISNGID